MHWEFQIPPLISLLVSYYNVTHLASSLPSCSHLVVPKYFTITESYNQNLRKKFFYAFCWVLAKFKVLAICLRNSETLDSK